jgi:uncharacterized protein with GYD domain
MILYLTHAAYKDDGQRGRTRRRRHWVRGMRPAIEALRGRLLSIYTSYSEHDAVIISEMPENVAAATVSKAVAAGEAVKSVRTAPLVTGQEGIDAMRGASRAG